jgi:ABC-type glycerol-3-phosphate transport system substrate-binding protein
MYTNLDVLKANGIASAPTTWADWEKAVQASTKKDASGKTTQYGYAGTTDASYFNAMVLSRGGKIMNDDNKTVAWAGKEGLETLQMLKRLYDGGYAYTPTNFDWQNDFGTKLAFVFQSTSSRPFIAAAMKTPVNWTVGNPPGGKTVMFGANVAVFKSTPQKQLASWLFIKWFSQQDNTADWATKSYYMPVTKSAANNEALKAYWTSKDPQGKQAYDIIGSSIPEPNVRGQQDIRDIITNMIVSVTTNKATPEAAIKDAETKANQVLKDAQ